MHKSPGCSVVMVFVLVWRGISYLEKAGNCWGWFFKGREQSLGYHGLPVVATTTVVDPTVKSWQPGLSSFVQVFGQWPPRAALGDPVFCRAIFCASLIFVPTNSTQIGAFSGIFLPSIYKGTGAQSREKSNRVSAAPH